MKTRTLSAILALFLLFSMLLSSCAASPSFKKVFAEPYVDENPTHNTAETLGYNGSNGSSSRTENLIVFREIDETSGYGTYFVYHLARGKSLLSVSETATLSAEIETRSIGNLSFFWVTTHNTINDTSVYQTALYDQNGTVVAQKEGRYNISTSVDLIFFDDDVYRISEDGTIAKAFSWSDLSSRATDLDYVTENYYYAFDKYSFRIYNKNLTPLYDYTIPEYAKTITGFFLLDSGDILYQLATPLPADATEFDIFMPNEDNGGKYLMKTILFNTKKQTETELKFPYLIRNIVCKEAFGFPFNASMLDGVKIGGDIKNIGTIYEIKDGYIDTNDKNALYVSLSNSGKIDSVLNDMLDNMLSFPERLNADYYVYEDHFKHEYLLNNAGEKLGEISAVIGKNETYLYTENKIYTYDLQVAYNLTSNKMTVLYNLDNALLLTDEEGAVFLFDAKKSITPIADFDNTFNSVHEGSYRIIEFKSRSLFCVAEVSEEQTLYYYYNDSGTLLYTSNIRLSLVTTSYDGTASLYTGTNAAGKTVYVRFHAA